jgi:CheY-like chemotaxis protein/light-regulated signal transduction histidine kinase (bacteriophytochrome)
MLDFNPKNFVILVVDDNPTNIQLVCTSLKKAGYSLTFAFNGIDALNIIKTTSPDLILLDLFMPEMNGLQVCEIIKANPQYSQIPVIFLTASNNEEDLLNAFEIGAEDYLTKPVSQPELLARVKTHLQLKQQTKNLLITNQKLQETNQQLETFSYTITHDLRNHLQAIDGFLSIFQYRYQSQVDEKGKEILSNIKESCQMMDSMITSISNLSKLQRIQLNIQPVNLSKIVSDIHCLLEVTQPERKVELKIVDDLIVNCDEKLMRIALENLLNNACKYSQNKPETIIEFGVYSSEISKEELNKILSNSNLFTSDSKQNKLNILNLLNPPVYFIKDNGVGFDINKAGKIFSPFQRLHSDLEFEGSGIGLATVERIIKAHNGYIWCQSEINQGATFYFTINLEGV